MIGMPATRCAMPAWVWPATIASTAPGGSARASWKISLSAAHDARSSGGLEARARAAHVGHDDHHGRARRRSSCAAATTARRERRDRAGRRSSPPGSCAAWRSWSMPMMPTLTPATCEQPRVGGRSARRGGAPVATSTRLAPRNGNRASAARALSAPRGSSAGRARRGGGSDRPEVELVIADRDGVVAEQRCRRARPRRLRPGSTPASPGTCRPRRAARRRRRLARAPRRRLAR